MQQPSSACSHHSLVALNVPPTASTGGHYKEPVDRQAYCLVQQLYRWGRLRRWRGCSAQHSTSPGESCPGCSGWINSSVSGSSWVSSMAPPSPSQPPGLPSRTLVQYRTLADWGRASFSLINSNCNRSIDIGCKKTQTGESIISVWIRLEVVFTGQCRKEARMYVCMGRW